MYAVKLLIQELLHGRRQVITNLALKLPELNEYLQTFGTTWADSCEIMTGEAVRRLSDRDSFRSHITERVLLLSEEQTGSFYKFRPYKFQADEPEKGWPDYAHCKRGEETKTAFELGGVLYIIDEIHQFFNAREWAKTGKSVLFYLSQHRKLGDDVICITQSIGNVDKQFRSVAQDFTYLRNFRKERYGWFRSFPFFMRQTYLSPVTGAAGDKAIETGTFTLDTAGLGSVYDTAAGVGILGAGADTKESRKGLPMWLLFLLIIGGLVALGCTPYLLGRLAGKTVVKSVRTREAMAPHVSKVETNTAASTNATQATAAASVAKESVDTGNRDRKGYTVEGHAKPLEAVDDVELTLFTVVGNDWAVGLSNGEFYKNGDTAVEYVTKEFVVIRGRVYRWNALAKSSRMNDMRRQVNEARRGQ